MATLVVPGVRVEARFDVLPPLPAPSGVIGVAAIIDRPPDPIRLVGVTKAAEIADVLGPGTVASAPEIVHALGNGASEVVVSPVLGGSGGEVRLLNANSDAAVILRTRSNGGWASQVAVDVRTVNDSAGNPVRVSLRAVPLRGSRRAVRRPRRRARFASGPVRHDQHPLDLFRRPRPHSRRAGAGASHLRAPGGRFRGRRPRRELDRRALHAAPRARRRPHRRHGADRDDKRQQHPRAGVPRRRAAGGLHAADDEPRLRRPTCRPCCCATVRSSTCARRRRSPAPTACLRRRARRR